jgi:hypothetical protein
MLILGVAAICNVHAIVAIVLALLRRTELAARQLARRTSALTYGFAALAALVLAVGALTHYPAGEMSQADWQRHFSNLIVEALYGAAFVLVAALIPFASTTWLLRRARRLHRMESSMRAP